MDTQGTTQAQAGHHYPWNDRPYQGSGKESAYVYRERNAKLVAALRSGEFTQVFGTLQRVSNGAATVLPTVEGQCCLGVACHVVSATGGVRVMTSWTPYDTVTEFTTINKDGTLSSDSGIPPSGVWQWFGWEGNNPELWVLNEGGDERQATATKLNDSDKMPFGGIADAFERTFVTYTTDPDPNPSGEVTSDGRAVVPGCTCAFCQQARREDAGEVTPDSYETDSDL